MPLEPGESPPLIRRRVGTAYQLSENLIKNANNKEDVTELELQIQLHANLAEAALGLANEQNISKVLQKVMLKAYNSSFSYRRYDGNTCRSTNNTKFNLRHFRKNC